MSCQTNYEVDHPPIGPPDAHVKHWTPTMLGNKNSGSYGDGYLCQFVIRPVRAGIAQSRWQIKVALQLNIFFWISLLFYVDMISKFDLGVVGSKESL